MKDATNTMKIWIDEQNPDVQPIIQQSSILGGCMLWQMNLRRPLFQDIRVRHALAYAIDRQFMSDVVGMGWLKVADTPFSGLWVSPDVPIYRQDQAKAEQLLDDAGYPRDPATGVRLRFPEVELRVLVNSFIVIKLVNY